MYSSFCHSYHHDTSVCTGIYGSGKLHDQDLKYNKLPSSGYAAKGVSNNGEHADSGKCIAMGNV